MHLDLKKIAIIHNQIVVQVGKQTQKHKIEMYIEMVQFYSN